MQIRIPYHQSSNKACNIEEAVLNYKENNNMSCTVNILFNDSNRFHELSFKIESDINNNEVESDTSSNEECNIESNNETPIMTNILYL